ncbi:4Fe-4S binding protein [Heliomarina baculiformis]|uniref:4Fe-4S binding protein n=1 Tax=Heliomarina baculiformis TaxID=2872036 RepID=UPI001EE39AD3|nr:4Fe-4S binding protein [Heliomarina baculiformis]
MTGKIILCDCAGSQRLDVDAIEAGGLTCSRVHTALCTHEITKAARFLTEPDVTIACGQEQAVFEDLAAELGVEAPGFVDLRDRAGWSEEGAKAGPKMAALVAESQLPSAQSQSFDVISEGVCLVFGTARAALPMAEMLAESLAVTVVLTDEAEPPMDRRFDCVRGHIRRLIGALGGFRVEIDGFQELEPGGRGEFTFAPPRDGAESECDIVIDVTGDTPLVPAPKKRDGYLRADPRDPLALSRLAFDAVQLVGTFEKPLYVRLDPSLCAHSRAGQTGCSNCLDICPTGAILPDGDHVAIDPGICAGCGACAALCPSTAITYDDPPLSHLVSRLQVLAGTYSSSAGNAPRLLVHEKHGAEMIRLSARFGRGLPADVIPFELEVISGFGHAEMLAALALGFSDVTILLAPTTDRDALTRESVLCEANAGSGRVTLLDESDPDRMSYALYAAENQENIAKPILPLGNRRQIARLSAQALNRSAEAPLPLPENAPYGAVLVDTDACTLCLSCVSLCPSGALMDNPDMPQLRFQEDACLQCGLCRNICPEDAITLEPRLDLSEAALTQKILNEEEPFACVECGSLFGVKSTIERVMEKLSGTHPMFATTAQARMIQMCDNCRVNAQFQSDDNPFKGKERPRPRTTDDYLNARRDH